MNWSSYTHADILSKFNKKMWADLALCLFRTVLFYQWIWYQNVRDNSNSLAALQEREVLCLCKYSANAFISFDLHFGERKICSLLFAIVHTNFRELSLKIAVYFYTMESEFFSTPNILPAPTLWKLDKHFLYNYLFLGSWHCSAKGRKRNLPIMLLTAHLLCIGRIQELERKLNAIEGKKEEMERKREIIILQGTKNRRRQ